MKKLFYFLMVCGIVVLPACETDFDVNDEWTETTIVYGLLNQNDANHYIKVNKAFLGEGNALEMAAVYDSISYAKQIEVYVQEWLNGNLKKTLVFSRDSSMSKDPGIFSYPFQVVYKNSEALDPAVEYRLIVKNTETGKTVTGTTSLVQNVTITQPTSSVGQLVNWVAATNKYSVKWTTGTNGKLYQLRIGFHYTETLKVSPYTVTDQYVEWVQPATESLGITGGENMQVDLPGDNFYQFLASHLEENTDVDRKADGIDFIIDVAGDEFNTYMAVNKPSTGIIQEKPEYTNLENGIGLFSCRYSKGVYDKQMTLTSLDSLRDGRFTKHLGFL
ncbi:MAG: hypothetical protein H6585_10925 [Flavobacteriales bacterium]|nr:hypothetical protein [Flavobacteriales bacterium]MCB9448846.1 hypothetical protein [Flavobacteriales bacterium]